MQITLSSSLQHCPKTLVDEISLTFLNKTALGFQAKPGYCTWYGECVKNPTTNKMYNCYYNGLAKDPSHDTELIKLLNETCPWLLEGNDPRVCCNVAQMKTLKGQIKTAQSLFSRCPACINNFLKHFCYTTCDPNMSLHIDPTNYINGGDQTYVIECQDENNKTITYLKQVEVYYDGNYGGRLYNSCMNVAFPQTSGKVMSLMCGPKKCNYSNWLNFMGDPAQNYNQAPFKMEYIETTHPAHPNMKSLNLSTTACDDTKSSLVCSCTDCPSKKLCPPSPDHSRGFIYMWAVSTGIAFVGTLISLLVSVSCMLHAIITRWKDLSSDGEDSRASSVSINDDVAPQTSEDLTCSPCAAMARVGARMDFVIKSIFYRWGVFASKFWFIVIPVSLGLFVVLAGGIAFFNVTTDPVKLWSSPSSRARQEKNYFDSHFSPFYRTEQVIITVKPNIYGYNVTLGGTQLGSLYFGPIYNKEVLLEAFYLQNNLSNIVAPLYDEENVTLEDICFKPLAPDNNNCTIESIFNYFQNDLERLVAFEADPFGVESYNATYHLHYCTR